ncbi:MAG: hypothetical protein COU40_01405 [Candidatus Moranbacteria bacterium CG10_big_fil_rev_8_21_14_0_10_35_21]|nr:MAG: hypothetical protein COU40_01405 [Candidatus Moranbacteria bacterium CG10_big_fil_rev_8_21_14_0_10_35_21]PJA88991.1 MAG: hypothetical protein CO139_00230 [Candidatus Moranbacteria bacterium CG_4_9_14_3_um_filter_36_9]
METLKKILAKKREKMKKPTVMEIDDKTVFFIFKRVINEKFGAYGEEKIQPKHFTNGTIFIEAKSSNLASELWLVKEKIIKEVNNKLGIKKIKEIKIKN